MIPRFVYLFIIIMFGTLLQAQAQDARSLIEEGRQLSNAHNYPAAIEKYKAALVADSSQYLAAYQLAFALRATGQGPQALPYLQRVVQATGTSAAMRSSAYGLMGGVYDEAGKPLQAIESYQQGLRTDSSSYALQYGLGLAYFRSHRYAEAEQSAVAALRLEPKQAAAMRLYALVTFHQNKRAAAFLALCSFLEMEPNGPKSAEAYSNLKQIIQGGELKPEAGVPRPKPSANQLALNQALDAAIASAAKRRYITVADQFSEQLQAVLAAVGSLAAKQTATDNLFKALAARYYALSQSPHVPTFARYIRQGNDPAAVTWLKVHLQQAEALNEWLQAHPAVN